MFAEQLRRAVEAPPRVELPKVASLLWRAYAAGQVSEAQAAELSDLIESRRALPAIQKPLPPRLGSAPSLLPRWSGGGAGPHQDVCRRPWLRGSRWPRPPFWPWLQQ